MKVLFAQQKNDTPRYAACIQGICCLPTQQILELLAVCPVFAFGLYLALFGRMNVKPTSKLFPGNLQCKCFVNGLMQILKNNEDTVCSLDYESY